MIDVKEYSSLDQLLLTEADEVEYVLYYSTDWDQYDMIPVSATMDWTKEYENNQD